MPEKQAELISKINHLQTDLTNTWMQYWRDYSGFDTWQFWVNAALLVVPLIILYIVLDRKRALLLGFYGLSVHMLASYLDAYGASRGLWFYPYKVLPVLPSSFMLDAALIPVAYMLAYQWVLNRKRNYYIYLLALGAVFAFLIKPALAEAGLFELRNGTTYFTLFLYYAVAVLLSKWVTNLFVYLKKSAAYNE